MKRLAYLIALILLFNCTSSDDSNNDDSQTSFTQAYVSDGDDILGNYDFQIMLMTSSRNVDLSTGPSNYADISGTGPLLYIEIKQVDNTSQPQPGLYSYNPSSNPTLHINWAWYQTAELGTVEINDTFIIDNGTIEISYEGGQMILDYNLNLISQDNFDITRQISGTYNQQVVFTDVPLW